MGSVNRLGAWVWRTVRMVRVVRGPKSSGRDAAKPIKIVHEPHKPHERVRALRAELADDLSSLARWQYGRVHARRVYDLKIDTSATTPAQNAVIIRAFGL